MLIRDFVNAVFYQRVLSFLKNVRFSHSNHDEANIFIQEWDIPLCCLYTITWQRLSNTTNITGLRNLVLLLSSALATLRH